MVSENGDDLGDSCKGREMNFYDTRENESEVPTSRSS